MDIVLSALLSGPPSTATLSRTFTAKMPRLIAAAEDDRADNSSVAAMIAYDLEALGTFLHARFEHNERRMNRGAVARIFTSESREVSARLVILYCQLAAVCALLRGDREVIAFYRGKALFTFLRHPMQLPEPEPALERRLGFFFDQLTAYR